MKLLSKDQKNQVLAEMINIIDQKREEIILANEKDLSLFKRDDQALYDRLVVNNDKVDSMIKAIEEVKEQDDPVNQEISNITLDTGLNIVNKTDPFGTILIIYESRPDVTIEAAVLAFKANNKILLKGGKEAKFSNKILVDCWHEALEKNNLSTDWISYLEMNREETQSFLRNPNQKIDLIVPRGGERLIAFVKEHAKCAVLISGRGNNFLYVSPNADWEKTVKVIINAKTDKISGCNALDKVLIDDSLDNLESRVKELHAALTSAKVNILVDDRLEKIVKSGKTISNDEIWSQEFLAMKIVLAITDSMDSAIEKINEFSGKHSVVIMTEDQNEALDFMQRIDAAAVYQNASTRFTDGGQMGVGAELAISTDKLHHRGPLGLKQLVTNKYYVFGDGHVRTS
jgi:glutamate-5-semialdehyde dehydrogenase